MSTPLRKELVTKSDGKATKAKQFRPIIDELKEKFATDINPITTDSLIYPKDYKLKFQNAYENRLFLDFDIKVGSDGQSIKVHKLFFIFNGFKNFEQCLDNITIDGDKHLIQSIVNFYYFGVFDINIDENVGDYLKIAKQFGNKELIDFFNEKKEEMDFYCALDDFFEIAHKIRPSVKRKGQFLESLPNKSLKCTDNMVDTESISITENKNKETNESMDESKQCPDNDIDFSITPEMNSTINSIKSQNIESINESSDTASVEDNMDVTQSDNESKQIDVSLLDTTIDVQTKHMTTQVTINLDEEDKDLSTTDVSIVHKKGLQRPKEMSSRTKMDFTRLIKSVTNQNSNNRKHSMALIQKQLRSNSKPLTVETDEVVDKFAIKYEINKFLSQNPKKIATQVWKSRFVPKRTPDEDQMVAVVGGPIVNWFNLDKLSKTSSDKPDYVFRSPENKEFRSIAVTLIQDTNISVIYAIGSIGCLYILKDPTEKAVPTYDKIDGFVGNDETVTDMVFQITPNSILLFCGTETKKIAVYDINFDKHTTDFNYVKKWEYFTKFPIASICLISKYDCLAVSGESSDIIVFKDVSTVLQKPIVGRITPQKDLISISSLVYIPEYDLICFRAVNSEYLQTIRMDLTINKMKSSQSNTSALITVPFCPGAKLQYRISKIGSEFIEFIDMSCNGGLIACGDAFGSVHIYPCNDLLKGKSIIGSLQIIEYQKWPNAPPKIRSVSISDDRKYMVTTSDNNLILISQPSID